MKKVNYNKISKDIIDLCKKEAENREYETAALTIFDEIRTLFTYRDYEYIITLYDISTVPLINMIREEIF